MRVRGRIGYRASDTAYQYFKHLALNAQLISAETGAHIWADRFEGERSRLGELQVEFVARLARSLDVQLTQAESLRSLRERPNNPTAADLAMRGWAALNRPRSKANLEEAISIFEQALKLDPEMPRALIGLSRSIILRVSARWSSTQGPDIDRADKIINQVVSNESEDAMARFTKADILRHKHDFDEALTMYYASIASDRNLAMAYATAGATKTLNGHAKKAIPLVETSLRLSLRDPFLNIWKYYMCHAYIHLADWKEAIGVTEGEKMTQRSHSCIAAAALPTLEQVAELAQDEGGQ